MNGETIFAEGSTSQMTLFNDFSLNSIMRSIVTVFDAPVKIILIIMLVLTIIMVGEIIAEYLERRYINIKATHIVEAIRAGAQDIVILIAQSKLLKKQKDLLLEICKHENLSNEMKENLAASLLDNYDRQQNVRIKRTELIVKLGPVFGLLGTLIPLGPGIIALAQGDTATLSYSLLAAFDTTVIGLVCAAVCTVLTSIRKNWYSKDKIMLTLILEAVVEYYSKKGN